MLLFVFNLYFKFTFKKKKKEKPQSIKKNLTTFQKSELYEQHKSANTGNQLMLYFPNLFKDPFKRLINKLRIPAKSVSRCTALREFPAAHIF